MKGKISVNKNKVEMLAEGTKLNNKTKRAVKYDKVINSCLEKIYKKGYHATTTNDLATAARVSKGGLYNYIKSKENLLSLAIDLGLEKEKRILDLTSKRSSTEAMLANQIEKWLKYMDAEKAFVRFVYRETNYVPKKIRGRLLDKKRMRSILAFKEVLSRGVQKHEFKDINVEVMAFIIYTLGHMWALGSWYLKDLVSLKDYSRIVANLVLHGIEN